MKRSTLALFALFSLSIALPASAGWYAEHDHQRGDSSVAPEQVDHGFMPGIIHDRAPQPICERDGVDCTLLWGGRHPAPVEPDAFVWWTELEHLIGRFRP